MRKALLGALLLCMLLPAWARAEVRIGQESPADWAGKDVLRLTQLDTNRSDCLLLECGGQSMFIDGGLPAFRFYVAAYLRESGHEHLDYLFNTHPHDDHIAVTIELVKNGLITADAYLSPFEQGYSDKHGYQQRMERALAEASIPYTQVHEGDTLEMGGAVIEIHTMEQAKDANQRSAMLKVVFGHSTALLCADIPFVTMETYLAQLGAEYLKSDICKAPHHGIPCLLSGEGTLIMETDGTNWYVWQLPQRVVTSY